MYMDNEQELRMRARKIAEDKVGFYIHFVIYLMVNTFFIVLWWWSGGGFPWFVFILFFWGIGLVAHGVGTFMGDGYINRMADREYERLKERR
jgi:hypothetical protein